MQRFCGQTVLATYMPISCQAPQKRSGAVASTIRLVIFDGTVGCTNLPPRAW